MDFFCQEETCRRFLEIDESLLELDLEKLKIDNLKDLLAALECFKDSSEIKEKKTSRSPTISSFFEKSVEICKDFPEQNIKSIPLCKECATKRIVKLNQLLLHATKENLKYKEFIQQIEQENNYLSSVELDNELQRLEEEEITLRQKFKEVEEEDRILKVDLGHLEQEGRKINEIEERYWEVFHNFQSDLQSYQDEYLSVETKIANSKEKLDKLKVTNVYNDTFHIWFQGHFGTINGFRLGRLISEPVDWNEINAAWGQTTLLLHTIAKKLDYKFLHYRLNPVGSTSKIVKISDGSIFELYGSNDISFGRLFWYKRFDLGMVAFLGCLKEIIDYAESQNRNVKLNCPYSIEKDKIGDLSIKMQYNTEESWTKALKYMLTNLKFLLAWLAKIQSKV